MRRFVVGMDRGRSTFFPRMLGRLDLRGQSRSGDRCLCRRTRADQLRFSGVDPEATGRPSHHPSVLLKLYTLPLVAITAAALVQRGLSNRCVPGSRSSARSSPAAQQSTYHAVVLGCPTPRRSCYRAVTGSAGIRRKDTIEERPLFNRERGSDVHRSPSQRRGLRVWP